VIIFTVYFGWDVSTRKTPGNGLVHIIHVTSHRTRSFLIATGVTAVELLAAVAFRALYKYLITLDYTRVITQSLDSTLRNLTPHWDTGKRNKVNEIYVKIGFK